MDLIDRGGVCQVRFFISGRPMWKFGFYIMVLHWRLEMGLMNKGGFLNPICALGLRA